MYAALYPYIELDPVRMVAVVEQMRVVLIKLKRQVADRFARNAGSLIAELRTLDQAL